MLLSYNELIEDIVNAGVITQNNGDPIDLSLVNGASIDITLDKSILVEGRPSPNNRFSTIVDLKNKDTINMMKYDIGEEGYDLHPNNFILASTREKFYLPDNIVAEYVLKSSLARSGLQHMLAGYCDPWWSNSHLTLELKNETQFHTLVLKEGMKIGQVKFYKVAHVPHDKGYAVHGQYNDSKGATQSAGLK